MDRKNKAEIYALLLRVESKELTPEDALVRVINLAQPQKAYRNPRITLPELMYTVKPEPPYCSEENKITAKDLGTKEYRSPVSELDWLKADIERTAK